ncbi:flavin reductase family protein [Clostridium botulinum]|uniref:flavin reductase n=1 Tax=Clostridium botulinum TaxID=1491 RepID=UPI0007E27EF9|nr:flavin reductase [Clostridium botulinum]KEI80504.1 flavin reductase [Clostridium botulinum B2 331]NEZ77236.1 flavin reductase family protein [Clostridium botulinum]NEZ98742.1 flavin reductase family protein [Clostridium botulinum]NFA29938.1 flavin reductase family protein [Clostridium botulinum]NFA84307.1 flavin reductase family protein [Clostridium botulinum]
MSVNFTLNLEEAMEHLYKKGAFLTGSIDNKVNTMTISWGNIGFQWRKPVFIALVRESRYTKEFIDKSNEFTVTIPFGDTMKEELAFCGSKSGRAFDKIKECNFKLRDGDKVDTPVIESNGMHYECKVIYKQPLDLKAMDKELINTFYNDGNNHVLYYGEILNCYKL